jgi:glutamate-5-semialdehyde dehydrogenase
MWKRPNGLIIGKMRVPIGVIGIIYESRPNVTADCASLCLKSSNAVILKGGKESINSNLAIYSILRDVLKKSGLPQECIGMVSSTERKAVEYLLKMDSYVDLIIPRGGEGLIRMVAQNSRIPVIKHYKGVCHVYVDKAADFKKAIDICVNAKVQRPGVCNAMETLLVDKKIANEFLPLIIREMMSYGVEIRGCKTTKAIIPDIRLAKESDWYEEYLDLILSVRVVKGVDGAIEHITKYGSSHSDAIVTEDYRTALKFLKEVDSACVYSNASTRFTDGYQFGFGAEIGISTDKIHARGPMALEELTSYKYIIFGSGQTRKA